MPGCFGVISLGIAVLAASERSSERLHGSAPTDPHKSAPQATAPEYHELQEPIPSGIDWFHPTVREISQGGVLHDAVHNVKKAADLMKSVAGNVVDALHAHEDTVVEAKAHLDKTNLLSDELPKHILTELMLKDDSRMKSMNDALKGVFPADTDEMEDHYNPTVSLSEHGAEHAGEGALGKELEEEDEHVHQQDEELDREENDTNTETKLGFGDVAGMAVGATKGASEGEREGAAEKVENMQFPQPPLENASAAEHMQFPQPPLQNANALGQPQLNAFGQTGTTAFAQQPNASQWGSALGQAQPHHAFGQIAMPVQPQLLVDPASGRQFFFNSYTGQAQWAAPPPGQAQWAAPPPQETPLASALPHQSFAALESSARSAPAELMAAIPPPAAAALTHNREAEPHASVNRRTLALTGPKASAFQKL